MIRPYEPPRDFEFFRELLALVLRYALPNPLHRFLNQQSNAPLLAGVCLDTLTQSLVESVNIEPSFADRRGSDEILVSVDDVPKTFRRWCGCPHYGAYNS